MLINNMTYIISSHQPQDFTIFVSALKQELSHMTEYLVKIRIVYNNYVIYCSKNDPYKLANFASMSLVSAL